jgi:Zn-dependent protease with chaperone function
MGNSNLEIGLAALKQGDYQTAIATLENICEIELHESTRLRAQIALVQAYQKIGDRYQACQLCQTLIESESTTNAAQAKKWAMAKLRELSPSPGLDASFAQPGSGNKNPGLINDPTGFIPFESPANNPANNPVNPSPTTDPTGFVPLSPAPAAPKPPQPTNRPRPANSGKITKSQPTTANQPPNNPGSGVKRPPKPPPPPKSPLIKGQGLSNGVKPGKPPLPPKVNMLLGKPPNAVSFVAPPASIASGSARPAAPIPQQPRFMQNGSDSPTADPSPTPSPSPSPSQTPSPEITWRQAGRAKNWRKMKPVKQGQLFLVQVTTAIALFWLVREFVEFSLWQINAVLVKMPWVWPVQWFYQDQTWRVLLGLIGLFMASPWLMDLLLEKCYGLQPLSWKTLSDRSPEASKLLLQFSREQNIPQCKLGLLPTDAPMGISYGCLPRFARIVVSRGLLEKLEPDEIAAIYAGELGHIVSGTLPLMSLAILLLQIPYSIYLQVAKDGQPWEKVSTSQGQFMTVCATLISSVAYGLYWLLRWPVLWLSRLRLYHSDREAAQLTGNPNGLSRALLKIAIGMAEDIKAQGETNGLLEGFELLTPVGVRQAVTFGSCGGQTAWENLLTWDRSNPWRPWMTLNNSHLLLGDRLYILSLYAKFWQLEPELDFVAPPKGKLEKSTIQRFILQVIPFFGLPLGLALGLGFWAIGGLGGIFGIEQITWLWGDRVTMLSCLPIGISMGILLRINHFFPDLPPATSSVPELSELLTNPTSLPLDSQPICLEGKLLGRSGISNALAQDLILQSPGGLIKLHCFSKLGPFAYIWPLQNRPIDLVGSQVKITGWFRRGATVWVDVENMEKIAESQRSRLSFPGGHPIWSTILAAIAALWGVYLNLQGGTP